VDHLPADVVVTALLIRVPTGIIVTPFYTRMNPVQWWNYPVWVVTAALKGLIRSSRSSQSDLWCCWVRRCAVGFGLSVLAQIPSE
jgi:hypothetical protein